MEILREIKEMPEIKNTVKEIKNTFMGLLVSWEYLSKESLDLRISQYKIPMLKSKEGKKKSRVKTSEYEKSVTQLTKGITDV